MQIHDLTQQTPTTNSQLIFDTGSATHKALVSDIAKCIIEQYAGSTIGGTAQSLATAIENVNSYTYALDDRVTALPQNADLNDYTTPGCYVAKSTNTARTIVNSPLAVGFKLIVEDTIASGLSANYMYRRQSVFRFVSDTRYVRFLSSSNGGETWTISDWERLPTQEDIDNAYNLSISPHVITSGTDLNTLSTPGHYAATIAVAASCTNCPIVRAFRMTVETGYTGTSNKNYLRQTLVQSENGNTYVRVSVSAGASWLEWKKIATEGDVPVVVSSEATSSAAYTSLDDIPLNSVGQARFAADISPIGSEANLPYACFGSAAYKMIIVGRISSAENIYINTGNTSSWYGWKQLQFVTA